jgi:hypothetical protein
MSFFSLMPYESIPAGVKVVITTPEERSGVDFGKVLTFTCEDNIDLLVSQIVIILRGKERYEKMVIVIDPGEVVT